VEPWLSKLAEGDTQAAWDLFDARYRRLILATIRRLVPDPEDVMDVFGTVCQALSANDFSRLRSYDTKTARMASVATWLVAVVRNSTVDWLRHRDGRRRISVPSNLSPLQRQVYEAICLGGHSHVEAYELIRVRTGTSMAFHEFLRHVRETHRLAPCPQQLPFRRGISEPVFSDPPSHGADPAESAESARRLASHLTALPPDVRLAVQLFVVERMSAAEVAVAVGWPGAKTVYNRVYRALATLRAALEGEGIGPGDL
jgi:RNA polymerase sigma factor (sigma-70 family)